MIKSSFALCYQLDIGICGNSGGGGGGGDDGGDDDDDDGGGDDDDGGGGGSSGDKSEQTHYLQQVDLFAKSIATAIIARLVKIAVFRLEYIRVLLRIYTYKPFNSLFL